MTETQKAMVDLKYKLEHGLFVEKNKITYEEWYKTWMLEYKRNRVKNTTYNEYQKYYNSMLKKFIGDKKLVDIRVDHIQKMYNEWVEKEYASSSIKVVSSVLNGSFKQAVKNGLIERNPVELADKPRSEKRKRKAPMTKEQQRLFMEYARESYLYNLFEVMLRTGMRSGEIRGLKYIDIDKRNKVIHVRRTLVYIEKQGYFENTPKSQSSIRDIPLTKETLSFLDRQKDFWGTGIRNIKGYIFCNELGQELSRDRVQSEIDRITKCIREIKPDFPDLTPHTFRHTFATRAIEAGMQPQVLKTIMGHSTLSMTMDLYSHVLPDVKQEAMKAIESAF